MTIIQTENLTKIYGHGETAVAALHHLNLSVERRRVRRDYGTERLRQIDAAAFDRRTRSGHRGPRLARRSRVCRNWTIPA